MIRFSMIFAFFAFPAFAQTMYQSQQSAQAHCPNDTVVWLNTRTDIYHFQGERWYGNTEQGACVSATQMQMGTARLAMGSRI